MRLIFLTLLITLSLMSGCNLVFNARHPSDNALQRNFQSHEAAFNKLISMANEDAKVVRIAYDFTWLDNNADWPRPESQLGFSKDRWNEYRLLFKTLGLKGGINRSEDAPGIIFLMASTKGLVTGGSEKGYAFTLKEPSPLVGSLDKINIEIKDLVPVYQRLKGSWYLYYKEGG